VFDNRLRLDFSPEPDVLGQGEHCGDPTNEFHNCADHACRRRILLCGRCSLDDANVRCALPAHGAV
jgi:UPF0176 protein